MHDPIRIRRASTADVPFLIETICEAEKAGSDCLSYCRIFDLDEAAFGGVLDSMLREDLEGQELCISGFLIAESCGVDVGACCAWVEGATGASSAVIKANLLLHTIDPQRVRAAQVHFRKLEEIYIARASGAIQVESVYVRAAGRGRGIAGLLIEHHLAELLRTCTAGKAQVILTASNHAARAAYTRAGFIPAVERWGSDASLLALVPDRGKVLMERSLSRISPAVVE